MDTDTQPTWKSDDAFDYHEQTVKPLDSQPGAKAGVKESYTDI